MRSNRQGIVARVVAYVRRMLGKREYDPLPTAPRKQTLADLIAARGGLAGLDALVYKTTSNQNGTQTDRNAAALAAFYPGQSSGTPGGTGAFLTYGRTAREEREPAQDDVETYEQLRATYAPQTRRLVRTLQQLLSDDTTVVRRQTEGDGIDLDAAIDYMIALRAGSLPDDRVFENIERSERSVGAALLVDLSGSMSDNGRLGHARASIVQFVEALREIGDDTAVYGFSTVFDENVTLVKRLQDRLTPGVKARIARMRADGHTPTADAVEYVSDVLRPTSYRTKLLIVVTDGSPSGGPEPTRQALEKAQRDGIKPYSIIIGDSAESFAEAVAGTTPYVIVPDARELPNALRNLYADIATSKRTEQRAA